MPMKFDGDFNLLNPFNAFDVDIYWKKYCSTLIVLLNGCYMRIAKKSPTYEMGG
jgi:hypothetical protein